MRLSEVTCNQCFAIWDLLQLQQLSQCLIKMAWTWMMNHRSILPNWVPLLLDKMAPVQGSGGEDPGDAAQQLEDGQQ